MRVIPTGPGVGADRPQKHRVRGRQARQTAQQFSHLRKLVLSCARDSERIFTRCPACFLEWKSTAFQRRATHLLAPLPVHRLHTLLADPALRGNIMSPPRHRLPLPNPSFYSISQATCAHPPPGAPCSQAEKCPRSRGHPQVHIDAVQSLLANATTMCVCACVMSD